MCITETWTYDDCGCQIEHHLLCQSGHRTTKSVPKTSTFTTVDSSPSFRARQICGKRVPQARSSPLRNFVLTSDLDLVGVKLCEDRHFVLRRFLEPICDLCVLKEHRELMALYAEESLNGEGLVWSSEVQIEIDPVSRDSVSISRLAHVDDDLDNVNIPSRPRGWRNIDTPLSDEDADDEGSLCAPSPVLTDVRGRPRSRTKQFRRRGIDLSRDELRISSRWDKEEKQSMEDFRSAIKDKANGSSADGVFNLWNDKRGESRTKETRNFKNVVRDFRSSVSRGRRGRFVPDIALTTPVAEPSIEARRESQIPLAFDDHRSLSRSQQPRPILHRVQSSMSLRRTKLPKGACTIQTRMSDTNETDKCSPRGAMPYTSWQRHLEQDLCPTTAEERHGKKGRYLVHDGTETIDSYLTLQSRAVPPSNLFPDHNAAVQQVSNHLPRIRPSVTMSELSDRRLESYWRLPSLVTSASYSYDLTSRGFSTGYTRSQKSGNVMSSRELDTAWWKATSPIRNLSSTSSQPVTTIASRSTSAFSGSIDASTEHARAAKSSIADLVAALKLKLAADINEYETTSVRPLLQPSAEAWTDLEDELEVSEDDQIRRRWLTLN